MLANGSRMLAGLAGVLAPICTLFDDREVFRRLVEAEGLRE